MELLFAKVKWASGLGLSLPWDQGCWWGLSWPGPECTHHWPQAPLTLPADHSVTVACSAAWTCSSVLLSAGVETQRMVCRSVSWHHQTAVMIPPQSWQNVVYLSTWNGKNPIPGLVANYLHQEAMGIGCFKLLMPQLDPLPSTTYFRGCISLSNEPVNWIACELFYWSRGCYLTAKFWLFIKAI